MTRIRNRAGQRGGDEGFAIVLVALLLILFMIVAAIVVDLGNARQQKRQAVGAADAGALAGAKALGAGSAETTTAACPALSGTPPIAYARCVAAYYTFSSAHLTASTAFAPGACTPSSASCSHYSLAERGTTTVDVTSPYTLPGQNTADSTLLHVEICWDTDTTFGKVIGTNSVHVCGKATAKITGNGGGDTVGTVTKDCAVEDNFETLPVEHPQIYTFDSGGYPDENHVITFANGNKTPKNKEDIVAVFDGHGTDIDLTTIVFKAPTFTTGPLGQSNAIPRLNPTVDNHGPESDQASGAKATGGKYVVQSLDSPVYAADGTLVSGTVQPYHTGGSFLVLIAYQLPDDAHLKVGGQNFVYTADLHVNDSVGNSAPPAAPNRCGNASWTFTHDGHNLGSSGGSTCGENSFFAYPSLPLNQQAAPGDLVQSFYTDESVIQSADVMAPNAFGIDFSYTPEGGSKVQIPPTSTPGFEDPSDIGQNPVTAPGHYWITNSDQAHSKDKFNSTINWRVPNLTSGNYTIFLKAYDTDNNKPGNDCGVATWTIGVTGLPGNIRLIE